MQHAQARALIADVERTLTAATAGQAKPEALAEMRTSWDALVTFLAIPSAPAVRDCPTCGRTIMRDATRCVQCWTKSVPSGAHGTT